MKLNNIRRIIDKIYIDESNFITLEITCENVYFIYMNGKDQMYNSLQMEVIEKTFADLKST